MPFEALHALRVSLRSWRRTPGVAAAAILTLALGIGASTALFSLVHGILVRPLPYRDPHRLVLIEAEQDYEGASRPVRARYPSASVAAWPRSAGALADVAFFADGAGALSQQAGSQVVSTAVVEGRFFATVDGPVRLGRGLDPIDGAAPIAVISERLWRRHFSGADDVLGRTLTLNGQVLSVVGVASGEFQVPAASTDIWMTAGTARLRNPGCCSFTPIARLAPGASLAAATEEASATTKALAQQLPRQLADTRVRVRLLSDVLVTDARPALIVMSGAVGLLLTLAVANVSSLLLARQTARAHDLAVRQALGASSARLVADAMAECGWLSAAGCALGIALAWAGVRLLQVEAVDALPRLDGVSIDASALTFAVVVSSVVTTLVGVLPLVSRRHATILESRPRALTTSPRVRRALGVITIGQLAISVVLLVAASLLARSLSALLDTDMGIEPNHVATASINLAMDRTLTSQQQADLVARVVERVSAAPEVVAAGVGTSRPPDTSRMRITLSRGRDATERATYQAAGVPATPGYFRALGMRLVGGRLFTDADAAGASPVVILSEGTARRLFPDREAVGQRISLPVVWDGKTASEEMTVVGVVADVKFNGLEQAADDVVYRPFAQQPWVSAFLVVRTGGDPEVVASRLRAVVAAVDPAIALADAGSMDTVLSLVTTTPRVRSLILATFALLASVIAGVGLHGVVAYSVSQRRAEMGVRMAIGADAARIRRMVLGQGLRMALAGAVLGVLGAAAASRALEGLLYGVSAGDRVSFALAAVGVMAAGVVATWLPARGASRTDPAVVLRGD